MTLPTEVVESPDTPPSFIHTMSTHTNEPVGDVFFPHPTQGGQRGISSSLVNRTRGNRNRARVPSSPVPYSVESRDRRLAAIREALGLSPHPQQLPSQPPPSMPQAQVHATPGRYPIFVAPMPPQATPPLGSRRNPIAISPTPGRPPPIAPALTQAEINTVIGIYVALKAMKSRDASTQTVPTFIISALSSPVQRGTHLLPSANRSYMSTTILPNNTPISSPETLFATPHPPNSRRVVVLVVDSDDEDSMSDAYRRLPGYPAPNAERSSAATLEPQSPSPLSFSTTLSMMDAYQELPGFPDTKGEHSSATTSESPTPSITPGLNNETGTLLPAIDLNNDNDIYESFEGLQTPAVSSPSEDNIYEGFEDLQTPAVSPPSEDFDMGVLDDDEEDEFFDVYPEIASADLDLIPELN